MKKVFFILITCTVLGFVYFYIKQPRIIFIQDAVHIGLYESIDPYEYIDHVQKMDIKDIQIKNHVNISKLGQYKIEYIYQQKSFYLTVFVDDIIAPEFDVKKGKILLNETMNPEELVSNVKDDSKTQVYFAEDYVFDQLKTYTVQIIVEDSYGNSTKKTTHILVEEKDTTPPTLYGIDDMTILIGDKVDLKKGVTIEDDHDKNPEYIIDDSSLNIRKIGEYEIEYIVKDRSHNQQVYKRHIEVLSQYANRDAKKDGIKTCYLTFDDGPSSNTKELLKILDQYEIKATFFVTGTSPKDYHYIKEAYQKGHAIGLHTYSHDYEYIYSSLSQYIKDLNQIKEVVYKQTGQYSHILRFPGGSSNLVSKKYNQGIMKRLTRKVIDLGYQYYDWTSINGDGEGIKTIDGLKSKAMEEIQGYEDIMFLMHDSAHCENTMKALPSIIEYLKKEGYEFKIIEDDSPTFHHTVQN